MWMDRKHLAGFKEFLIGEGETLLEPHGEYEVMRWKVAPGFPMPIIYRSTKRSSLTVGKAAERYVAEYLKWVGELGY